MILALLLFVQWHLCPSKSGAWKLIALTLGQGAEGVLILLQKNQNSLCTAASTMFLPKYQKDVWLLALALVCVCV